MRRVVACLAAGLCLWGTPAAAKVVVDRGGDGSVNVGDSRPGDETRTPPASNGSGDRWYRYDVVLWDPATSTFCVDPRWTRNQEYAERLGRVDFPGRFDPTTGAPRPNCPDEAVDAPTPAMIAADVWQHVENLPVPTLDIEPDHAITGKKVYLQIHGAPTWTRTIDNPIGDDVVINATSDYVIDWGDPTYPRKDTTSSQGGPYPTGDVTHVYTHTASEATITVTQRWTATWKAGTRTGTLGQLTTQSPPLALEVRELEAVRRR